MRPSGLHTRHLSKQLHGRNLRSPAIQLSTPQSCLLNSVPDIKNWFQSFGKVLIISRHSLHLSSLNMNWFLNENREYESIFWESSLDQKASRQIPTNWVCYYHSRSVQTCSTFSVEITNCVYIRKRNFVLVHLFS